MGGGEFPILDAILVLVVLLELALGWLRGLLASVFGLVGLVAGAIARLRPVTPAANSAAP